MEHIISLQVMRHLDINDVLHDAQHGFRKRRSCETQILLSADDFLKTLDKNVQTDAILLDFSKAFDRVAHKHLLKKLEAIGVTGTTLGWISSFLTVLEGMSSDAKPVTSGVPQGTVLGPLLFLIYNDLPNCVNSSTIRLFADDCLIYKEIHSQQDTEDLQTDLDALQTWERRWLMSFHPQKCQLLRITRKPSPIMYNIHGHVLEVADTAKYLGVTLHKHCAWSKHINQTAKKANNTRAFLQRNLRRAPTSVKKRAYETLVRPILEYAISVWDPHTEADIQAAAACMSASVSWRWCNAGMPDTPATTSAAPVASLLMLQQIGWDTLHERRAKSRLAMQFCIAH